jgi:galactose mutarotase-like enzyme
MGDAIWTAKENVLIRLGACAVTVRPDLGGKIASITIGDRELLQSPLRPCRARTKNMSFGAADASGWDECVPSVAACRMETSSGIANIPDHGDLWRVEWEPVGVHSSEPNSYGQGATGPTEVALRGRCFSLPLSLVRSLSLSETSKGWHLHLSYAVKNESDRPVPWSWSAHPLFVVEAGDRILLPPAIRRLRVEGSAAVRLGAQGDEVIWPVAKMRDGSLADLSVVMGAESKVGDKLFAGPLGAGEGWCALERLGAGIRIRVCFEPAKTPYLGLWICYGGWPDGPGPKQMCVALEPATAPVDSLANVGAWSRTLGPRESFSWPMRVEIQSIQSELR